MSTTKTGDVTLCDNCKKPITFPRKYGFTHASGGVIHKACFKR